MSRLCKSRRSGLSFVRISLSYSNHPARVPVYVQCVHSCPDKSTHDRTDDQRANIITDNNPHNISNCITDHKLANSLSNKLTNIKSDLISYSNAYILANAITYTVALSDTDTFTN